MTSASTTTPPTIPTVPTVDDVRRALAGFKASRVPLASMMKGAAVAAIARDSPHASDGAELLFIRRAEHPRDPWSGHMAFPGGRVDPTDEDPLAAAVRETHEEIGLDLIARASLVAELSNVPTMTGKPLPMVIRPFVFELRGEAPQFALSEEVAEVVWVPLAFFLDARNRQTMPWKKAGVTLTLPCYRYEERLIWGLTLRMVDELTGRLRRS